MSLETPFETLPSDDDSESRGADGAAPGQAGPATGGQPALKPGDLIDRLREAYPKAFCHPRKPLKIGIHRDILEREPGLDPKLLGSAMRMWVRGNPYLKAVARAAPRVDLEGNPAGVPTHEEITQAIGEIFKRTGETLQPPRPASPYAHPDFKRAKTILNDAPLGVPLAGDERDFMLGVLTRHPEAGRKSAEGATGILVNEHRKSGNRCFFLIRADGVTESFSLVKCFEASTPRTQAASPSSPANPVTPARPATPEIVEATVRVKAAKVIVPVRIEQFPKIDVPEGAKAPAGVDLVLKSGEVALHATINRKSFRKAMRTIEESPAGTFVVVQGALGPDGTILEAGMVVQPPRGEAAKSGEA